MKVLCIEPGHGSVWLLDAIYHDDDTVSGIAWDDTSVGSPFMPDDYRGEPVTMTFPRNLVIKEEAA